MSLGNIVLVLVIYLLATARITRLVNFDIVTDPLRQWVFNRAKTAQTAAIEAESAMHPAIAKTHSHRYQRWAAVYTWSTCPWCAGLWFALAGAGIVVWLLHWHWLLFIPVGLAASYLIGMANPLVADDDIEIVAD